MDANLIKFLKKKNARETKNQDETSLKRKKNEKETSATIPTAVLDWTAASGHNNDDDKKPTSTVNPIRRDKSNTNTCPPLSFPEPNTEATLHSLRLIQHPNHHNNHITAVVFDLETTGFSFTSDYIVEIGAVTVTQSKHNHKEWRMGAHSFHRYVRLPTECCEEQRNIQSSVHGLTRQFLTSSCVPTWSAVATDLLKFLTTISRENHSQDNDDNHHNDILLPPLIAHNAGFDSRFLDHCFSRLGYNQPNGKRIIYHSLFPHTCTKQLMNHYYQQYYCHNSREGTSLESSCSVFGMDAVALRKKEGRHAASTDARLTAELFIHLAKCMPY